MKVNWLGKEYDLLNTKDVVSLDYILRNTNLSKIPNHLFGKYIFLIEILAEQISVFAQTTNDENIHLLYFEVDKLQDYLLREYQKRKQ